MNVFFINNKNASKQHYIYVEYNIVLTLSKNKTHFYIFNANFLLNSYLHNTHREAYFVKSDTIAYIL